MIIILRGKHGDYPVYARDDAEKARAFLHLFEFMDSHGFYTDVEAAQAVWRDKARKGDAQAAEWLVDCRSDWDYEYERIEIIHPLEP